MTTGKQLFSTLADGKLTLEIAVTSYPDPIGDQVLVQMEAAPINPSDLALLTGAADLENAEDSDGRFVADIQSLSIVLRKVAMDYVSLWVTKVLAQ